MADETPNVWAILVDGKVQVRGEMEQLTDIYTKFVADIEAAEDADWIPNTVELVKINQTVSPKKEVANG